MKNKYTPKEKDKIIKLFAPSLLGIMISIVCLAGTSWAWFTSNSTTSMQPIQSAEYSVDVKVKEKEQYVLSDAIDPEYPTYSISYSALEPEKEYTVILTPNGTAKNGYCIIAVGGKFYYTNTIPKEGLTFTYKTGLPTEITNPGAYDEAIKNWTGELLIAWYWGKYPDTQGVATFAMDNILLLSDGDVIGNELTTRPEEKASISLNLSNVTADKENGELTANSACVIRFTAAEGYTLPESITVNGIETYTYEKGILTISADQIKEGTGITVTAEGVKKTEESVTPPANESVKPPETATATPPATEQPTSPEEEKVPTEPGITPTEGDTPSTESTGTPETIGETNSGETESESIS